MEQMWEFKQSTSDDTLELYIYGDVKAMDIDWENWRYVVSENSAKHFREELEKHKDVKQINIYINSYGGSVFEGTAIYNQLKRHSAQKTVYIDGFACSVAATIAMAGDKVVMPRNAMMMIHNAWLCVCGNSAELRKAADDLDTMMKGNRQAYLKKVGDKLTEEKLIQMLDAETWMTAEECIEMGFADEYAEQDADMSDAAQVLQKANMTLEQRIKLQQSLSTQLRSLIETPAPNTAGQQTGDQNQKNEHPEGAENKPYKMMKALLGGKEEE